MIKLKPYSCKDNNVFGCEAFSILVPEGWIVSGGIVWRQHATMPGAVDFSVKSSDGLYELRIMPSMPYYYGKSFFSPFQTEGSYYMGNEIRRPVSGYLEYIEKYILLKNEYNTKILRTRPFPQLEDALRKENQGGFGSNIKINAGVARVEYKYDGRIYEGDLTCGIVINQMMYGQTSWIADKIISTRIPKSDPKGDAILQTILNSFRFNIEWFNLYLNFVQALTQTVMQDIYNAGLISRIITNTYNQISDMVRHSYENQQATNAHVFRGISESIRGVNSYYDPYKGYSMELPNGYRYVYANPLGEYIMTDNPNYNPNINSNMNWTNLNQV